MRAGSVLRVVAGVNVSLAVAITACKRCQLIDLGEWAAEEKRIASSGDLTDSDDWSEEQQ